MGLAPARPAIWMTCIRKEPLPLARPRSKQELPRSQSTQNSVSQLSGVQCLPPSGCHGSLKRLRRGRRGFADDGLFHPLAETRDCGQPARTERQCRESMSLLCQRPASTRSSSGKKSIKNGPIHYSKLGNQVVFCGHIHVRRSADPYAYRALFRVK